jgi:hypothetical protein
MRAMLGSELSSFLRSTDDMMSLARPAPFADVWDSEVAPLLRSAPKLKAITLLRKLQEDQPERFPDSIRRTFERHVSRWRALEGPGQEVFFPQTDQPGARGLSDFTHMNKLCVTIGGIPVDHMLYHFVLAFSRTYHCCHHSCPEEVTLRDPVQ